MKNPMRHKFYEAVRGIKDKVILVDGAIIIENQFIKLLNNHCILLSCDSDTAIERIMQRDGISLGQAKARLESQSSDSLRRKLLEDSIEDCNYGDVIDVDTSKLYDIDKIYDDIFKKS